ncbi:tetratricopeptide repeat protein [Opitutus sp. ER46]|uniref:tetratricopeptide repeat protein n=1 Tax=Opitutus sp. ER46 TaxID=2161864 RepID=UPI002102F1B5|nr:tetratricopeptide repeat protein [Opitutus sp. ER46]
MADVKVCPLIWVAWVLVGAGRRRHERSVRLLSLLLVGGLLAGCATGPERTVAPALAASVNGAPLDTADRLVAENRYAEAVPYFEEYLRLNPGQGDVVARLASALYMQGLADSAPARTRSLNRRARELAEQAEKLGTTNPMSALLLANIRPDGGVVPMQKGVLSALPEVEALLHQGESAFGRRDLAKALDCYQRAFAREPTNYVAALWTGDVYFNRGEYEPACSWFRKAAAIAPDRETAHRYLGDALFRLGRGEDAYQEWITAVVCDPYLKQTRQHFTAELRRSAESRGYTIPRFPAMESTLAGAEIKLAAPDDDLVLTGYNLAAITWRATEFDQQFPGEKGPRRTLSEEISAIQTILEVAESAAKDADAAAAIKKWEPVLSGLQRLKCEGLLEAYVLLERADRDLVNDYPGYAAQHRDAIERYVRQYWCGLSAAPAASQVTQ